MGTTYVSFLHFVHMQLIGKMKTDILKRVLKLLFAMLDIA